MAFIACPPPNEQGKREDPDLMTRIYEEFHLLMYFAAGLYITDPHDKKDVVQDSLERLLHKAELLRELAPSAQSAYIFATVRNTSLNHLRHQRVVRAHTAEWKEWQREQALGSASAPEPDEIVALREMSRQLERLWDKLPERDRILLRGKYIEGLSDEALAARLGCQPSSIRMFLTRARRDALKRLTEEER